MGWVYEEGDQPAPWGSHIKVTGDAHHLLRVELIADFGLT